MMKTYKSNIPIVTYDVQSNQSNIMMKIVKLRATKIYEDKYKMVNRRACIVFNYKQFTNLLQWK